MIKNHDAEGFRRFCRGAAALIMLSIAPVVGWELYTGRAKPVSLRNEPAARLHGVLGHGPVEFWRAIRDKMRLAGGGSVALLLLGEAAVRLRRRDR